MTTLFDRRVVLGRLGAAVAPFALARALAANVDPFTLGVAAGEPTPDGLVLWTRLAPEPLAPDGSGGLSSAPVQVRWEVFADEALRRPVVAGEASAEARWGHSVHVEVAGLEPARPYWYRFTALGAQSPVGLAKTAPAPGAQAERLRLCVASCAHYEVGFFSAYRHMADEAPDLMLFLGDYIYEYSYRANRTDLVRRHEKPGDILTLADYRNRYALQKTDRDLQAAHQAAAMLATWDDHEVHNDYAGRWSQDVSVPEEAFLARRAAAYQAFYEHMPLRRRSIPQGANLRLNDRHRFGALAEISVVDGRQHRSRQACPTANSRRARVAPESCPDFTDPARTFLGREQEAWLYEGFRKSSARWNLIAQPLLFSPYVQKGPNGALGHYTDSWTAHGQSRDRLIEAITGANLANPVVLGGDSHCFVAADVKADYRRPESRTVASEFVTTSITSDKMPDIFGETLDLNPHVKFFDNAPRGYLSVALEAGAMLTRLRAISDRRDPAASVSTLKTFAVEAGRPGAVAG